MSSNHLALCCPLLLLPSIFPASGSFFQGEVPLIKSLGSCDAISPRLQSCVKGQNLEGAGGSLQGKGQVFTQSPSIFSNSGGHHNHLGSCFKCRCPGPPGRHANPAGLGWGPGICIFLVSALRDSGAVVCGPHSEDSTLQTVPTPELLSLLIQPSVLLPRHVLLALSNLPASARTHRYCFGKSHH